MFGEPENKPEEEGTMPAVPAEGGESMAPAATPAMPMPETPEAAPADGGEATAMPETPEATPAV